MTDELDNDEDVKKDNKNRDSDVLAIQNLMKTEGGRDFIWGQLQSCGVFESIFDTDPVQSGYNSGMRDSGLRLQREVKEATPEYYLKMIKENINN